MRFDLHPLNNVDLSEQTLIAACRRLGGFVTKHNNRPYLIVEHFFIQAKDDKLSVFDGQERTQVGLLDIVQTQSLLSELAFSYDDTPCYRASLTRCRLLGEHAAGARSTFSPLPEWSDEQKAAYTEGWNTRFFPRISPQLLRNHYNQWKQPAYAI